MQAYFSERAHFVLTSERILTKLAPSWIQSGKRLGERRKGFLVSGYYAERGVMGEGEGNEKSSHFLPPPSPTVLHGGLKWRSQGCNANSLQ